MRLEHHLVGGYVRYICPHIIIIIQIMTDLTYFSDCYESYHTHIINMATHAQRRVYEYVHQDFGKLQKVQ